MHRAISSADSVFAEGAVGGGTGMVCMDLKGGIGSASRLVPMDGKEYTVGALVMSNFGMAGNLVIGGRHVGREIAEGLRQRCGGKPEQCSIIIILATDLPLNERQLRRTARRSAAALGRVGSFLGNGSGDIAPALPDDADDTQTPQAPPDDKIARREGPFTAETPFSTRFFVLHYTSSGTLTQADLDNIASVTEDDTQEYLSAALAHGAGYGYFNSYRFFVAQTEPAAFAKSAASRSSASLISETGLPVSMSFVRNAPKKLSPEPVVSTTFVS